jgi:hypothetical protein
MARIKYFEKEKIAIYIYGEAHGKNHKRHILVLKRDEDCQYGFDGKPLDDLPPLKNKSDRELVEGWILSHRDKLEQAWIDINNGVNPGTID